MLERIGRIPTVEPIDSNHLLVSHLHRLLIPPERLQSSPLPIEIAVDPEILVNFGIKLPKRKSENPRIRIHPSSLYLLTCIITSDTPDQANPDFLGRSVTLIYDDPSKPDGHIDKTRVVAGFNLRSNGNSSLSFNFSHYDPRPHSQFKVLTTGQWAELLGHLN